MAPQFNPHFHQIFRRWYRKVFLERANRWRAPMLADFRCRKKNQKTRRISKHRESIIFFFVSGDWVVCCQPALLATKKDHHQLLLFACDELCGFSPSVKNRLHAFFRMRFWSWQFIGRPNSASLSYFLPVEESENMAHVFLFLVLFYYSSCLVCEVITRTAWLVLFLFHGTASHEAVFCSSLSKDFWNNCCQMVESGVFFILQMWFRIADLYWCLPLSNVIFISCLIWHFEWVNGKQFRWSEKPNHSHPIWICQKIFIWTWNICKCFFFEIVLLKEGYRVIQRIFFSKVETSSLN